MRIALFVLAGTVGLVATIGVVFVVGMRRKTPAVLEAVKWTSRATKRFVLKSAGSTTSPTAVVRHVGRTSGRAYETPVVAVPVDGGFAVALPYGMTADWAKNVLATGKASIVLHGTTHDVDGPELVAIDAVDAYFAPREQRMHKQFGVREAMRLRAA